MNKILSLFSGAGGIDIGFKSNSFETYAAVDNWNIACDTLKKNKISKNVICSDIKDVNFSKFNARNFTKICDFWTKHCHKRANF